MKNHRENDPLPIFLFYKFSFLVLFRCCVSYCVGLLFSRGVSYCRRLDCYFVVVLATVLDCCLVVVLGGGETVI